MRSATLLLICVMPLTAAAQGFCERSATVDPEVPAGFDGSYTIVGREPGGGEAYYGTLTVAVGKTAYALTRRVGKTVVKGEGWIEFCSADRIMSFAATYDTVPVRTEMTCALGGDGDNYTRITCRTRREGDEDGEEGLEAMFQQR